MDRRGLGAVEAGGDGDVDGKPLEFEYGKGLSDELDRKLFRQQGMKLSGWETGDFEVQISRLFPTREIADCATHYPDSSTAATDALFNAAKDPSKCGIFETETDGHLDLRFTKELSRLFR